MIGIIGHALERYGARYGWAAVSFSPDRPGDLAGTAPEYFKSMKTDVDESYLMKAKDHRPAVGKEQYQYILTPKGWEAHKDDLEKRFKNNQDSNGTWDEVEKEVVAYYEMMRKKSNKFIKQLKEKVVDANAEMAKFNG